MSLMVPYQEIWDMSFYGTSREHEAPHWTGNFLWGVVTPILKLCFRFHVYGRENLRGFKNKSGVVVVANHTSFLDVVFMYLTSRPSQWLRILGRENLFSNGHGAAGFILSRVGGFPIKRDSADKVAIKRATRMLKNNEIVGILPEGTRRGKGTKTPEIHSGVTLIARMGKAPILPMTVRNAEYVKQKGKFLRFPKITIEYGKPLLVSDFDFLPKEQRLDGCAWYAMRECFALSRRVTRDEVDMCALFPGSTDFTDVFREHPIPEHTTEEIVADLEAKAAAKAQAAAGQQNADEKQSSGEEQDAAATQSATDKQDAAATQSATADVSTKDNA